MLMKKYLLLFVLLVLPFSSCEKERIVILSGDTQAVCAERVTDEYILNIRTEIIHKTTCGTAALIHEENRMDYTGDPNCLFEQGYRYCGNCYR